MMSAWGQGVAQVVEHSPAKVGIIWLSLHGGCICSLGYFPFQPVVHNWSIKGGVMCCPVCRKMHIKYRLLLFGKSSLCGDIRFALKKYVKMTIYLTSNSRWYENQCALEASLNKTNFASTPPSTTYLHTHTRAHTPTHPHTYSAHLQGEITSWLCPWEANPDLILSPSTCFHAAPL